MQNLNINKKHIFLQIKIVLQKISKISKKLVFNPGQIN